MAKNIGEKYNVEWYTTPSNVIERCDVDLISICTPTVTHADLAMQAILAGKNILVEKPMTKTVKEAEKLIEASSLQGIHLMVGFIERFNPAVRIAKEMIRKGRIGEIVSASSKRVSRWPKGIGDVGVVKELAIHDIDLIRDIFGGDVEKVYAMAGSHEHKFEDYAKINLHFKDGKKAFIEANWLTPVKVRSLTITGLEGIIEVQYISQEVIVETQVSKDRPIFNREEPLRLELEYLVNSILRNESPEPSGKDGLEALKICEAALKSAHSHNPVLLS
jgi:UDP-N-acetylglucosamine 3-dehydrogenase